MDLTRDARHRRGDSESGVALGLMRDRRPAGVVALPRLLDRLDSSTPRVALVAVLDHLHANHE